MPVISPTFYEGAAVRFILDRPKGASLFSVPGYAVAFEIARMGVGRAARAAAHFERLNAAANVGWTHPKRSGGVTDACMVGDEKRMRNRDEIALLSRVDRPDFSFGWWMRRGGFECRAMASRQYL